MQFSPFPFYLVPSSAPILENCQTVFVPQCDRPSFTPRQNNGQNHETFHKTSRHIVGFERKETLSYDYNSKLHCRPFPFTVLCLATELTGLSTVGKSEREKVAERLNAFVGTEDGRLEPYVMLSLSLFLSQASHRSDRMLYKEVYQIRSQTL